MRDLLLIDIWDRDFRRGRGRELIHAAECDIYIADDAGKALQMLKTAAMDAVVINLNGPEADTTGLINRIARAHPALDILYLSASESDRMTGKVLRYRGLLQYLKDHLRTTEPRQGTGLCLLGSRQSGLLSAS